MQHTHKYTTQKKPKRITTVSEQHDDVDTDLVSFFLESSRWFTDPVIAQYAHIMNITKQLEPPDTLDSVSEYKQWMKSILIHETIVVSYVSLPSH